MKKKTQESVDERWARLDKRIMLNRNMLPFAWPIIHTDDAISFHELRYPKKQNKFTVLMTLFEECSNFHTKS